MPLRDCGVHFTQHIASSYMQMFKTTHRNVLIQVRPGFHGHLKGYSENIAHGWSGWYKVGFFEAIDSNKASHRDLYPEQLTPGKGRGWFIRYPCR